MFTVTRLGVTTSALDVGFNLSGSATVGSDYTYPGSPAQVVTIPAGQTSASLSVTPTNDGTPEPSETVVLTLVDQATYDLGAETTATVTIEDRVLVTVLATDAAASEVGPNTGTFTFTRNAFTNASPLLVNFTVSGSATPGIDYASVGTSVTIPAGQNSATVTVTPVADGLPEPPETVVVTLASGQYAIGFQSEATVTIAASN